jgi:hypothetical protein
MYNDAGTFIRMTLDRIASGKRSAIVNQLSCRVSSIVMFLITFSLTTVILLCAIWLNAVAPKCYLQIVVDLGVEVDEHHEGDDTQDSQPGPVVIVDDIV